MHFISVLVVAMSLSLASTQPGSPLERATRGDRKHVDEGAVWNFGWMTSCATNSYSVRYNGYGCFCGIGGSGTAVDDLDSCCEVHDNCYGDLEAANGGPCPSETDIYTKTYSYDCTAPWSWFYYSANLVITCKSEANDECAQALCECDKEASLCFARNEFNEDYRNYDKANNC